MSDPAADKPWVIDGRTGATVTYGDLLAVLNQNPMQVRPLCQPRSTRDALQEIAAAVVFGSGLTLLDSDFGEHELATLGYSDAQVNIAVEAPGKGEGVTTQTLQGLAAGRSPARLGLFTSGSTGVPQLVVQPVANLARAVKVSDRHAQDVWGFAYNPTHVAGIQVYLQALANGCPVVDIFGLGRAEVLAAIARHGITHLSATPSFYRLMLPADRALPGVRSVTLGGESSDAALIDRLRPLFPSARFHNVYASTEAGTLLSAEGDTFSIADGLERLVVIREGKIQVHRSLLGEFGAAAKPSPPVIGEQLIDNGDKEAMPSEHGKLLMEKLAEMAEQKPIPDIQSPTTNSHSPLTAAGIDAADWYDTGDVVEIVSAEPLRFRIVARERDCVNVGGSKVNPHEVEAVLGEHPGVKQVRVFGRKNSVMGNILCAEVVAAEPPVIGELLMDNEPEVAAPPPVNRDELIDVSTHNQSLQTNNQSPITNLHSPLTAPQLTEAALREFAAARLQPFKVPRLIRFVDKIAQTRTGKVLRTDGGGPRADG